MTLKEKLLSLDVVIDNEYLDKYVELIESNRNTKREKFKTQMHHIVPRSYYKHCQKHVDDSKYNLVYLTHRNHVLAHYYLTKCASISWFKGACLNAVIKMIRDFTNPHSTNYYLNNEEALLGILDEYDTMMKESYELRSKLYKNRVFINNGVSETTVDKEYLNLYLSCGWSLGRIYRMSAETKEMIASKIRGTHHETSEETRRKIGEANKISLKGKKLSKERVEKIRKNSTGKTFYNNGTINIFIDKNAIPPKGFKKGMLITHVNREEWIRKAHEGRKPEDYNTVGGRITINDGKVNKIVKKDEVEQYLVMNWKMGKLPIGKLNWYNNGINNTRASKCPDGYIRGRLLTDATRKSLGNGHRNKKGNM